MEGKYRVKDGCLTVAMPKELDHHSALGLKGGNRYADRGTSCETAGV